MPYTADPYDDTKPTGATLALYLDEEMRATKGVLKDHRDRIVALEDTPASTTVAGIVELATPTETVAGTDDARAVTSAGVKAARLAVIRPVAAYTGVFSAGGVTDVADLSNNVAVSDYVRDIYANNLTWTMTFSDLGFDLTNSPRNFVLVGGSNLSHALIVTSVISATSISVVINYIPNEWDYADFVVSCVLYAAPIAP